jgi:heme O synthase-like polyprenyltransferase
MVLYFYDCGNLVHCTVPFTIIFFGSELQLMSKTENVKVRKHALPPVVLHSLSGTLIIVGVLLVLVLLGWYGSTLLTDGRWYTFTIVYAYWLTRRGIAIVISAGVLILIGTYMMQRQRITT